VFGLPGAAALGMEPTFYWDALSGEALTWLNEHTGTGEKVMFASNPTSWRYLHHVGKLRPRTLPAEPGVWVWYVVQNRTGSLNSIDRALIARGRPSFVVKKFGVPLVWIFPFAEFDASYKAEHGGAP